MRSCCSGCSWSCTSQSGVNRWFPSAPGHVFFVLSFSLLRSDSLNSRLLLCADWLDFFLLLLDGNFTIKLCNTTGFTGLCFLNFLPPPCHTRVTRHAHRFEVNKAESWRVRGWKNWKGKKEPKYTRHFIKVLVHSQSYFIALRSVEQGFLKGRHDTEIHSILAEGHDVPTVIQRNFLSEIAADRLRGTRSAS